MNSSCEHVDALVNNAAILYDTWQDARDADLDSVDPALERNLLGAWRVTQALLPRLSGSHSARIVDVSSQDLSLATMSGGTPAYSVSKAALHALARMLAVELRQIRSGHHRNGGVTAPLSHPASPSCRWGAERARHIWAGDPPAAGSYGRPQLERELLQMQVLMVRSKIKAESVTDVEATVKKMLDALDAAQPEGLRYAALLLPDGETIVALRQLDDAAVNPLEDLPEYKELLEVIEGVRAEPPVVEMWSVTGSYRLF